MGQLFAGAFPWGQESGNSEVNGDRPATEDDVAEELVEHVEACLLHIRRSSWWEVLSCEALQPTAAEVALVMLTSEMPERGSARAWDALTAVVRAMVLKRTGRPG